MGRVLDAYNVQCAHRVLSVNTSRESNKEESALMNGNTIIQVIGNSRLTAEVRAICTLAEKILLDETAADGTPVSVEHEGGYYDGVIRGQPSVSRYVRGQQAARIYEVTFTLIVGAHAL